MRAQALLGATLLFAGLVLLFVLRGDPNLNMNTPDREPPSITVEAGQPEELAESSEPEEGTPTSLGSDVWILEMESARGPGGRRRRSEPARVAESPARGAVVEAVEALPEGRGSITLAVQEASGLPLPEIAVSLRWLEEEGATGDALTDAGGEARFAGLAAGRYAYRVRAPGRPELVSATPIGLEEGERKRHVVRVAGAALSISGRVGDRAGEPLPGIEVSVVRHRYASPVDEAVTTPDRRTWTQEDGAYTLRGLAEGEYEVRTTATLRYASAKAIVRAGAESADLVLLEGLRVHGVVTDAGGARLDRVYVALVPPRDRFAYTDDEGRYQLDLQRGQAGEGLTFRFAKQGYEERQLALPALAGEVRLDAELVLLEDAAPVSGVVLTERGEPVAGATVLLRSRELGTQYQTVSDHNGRFSMPAVKVGPGYGLNVLPNSPLRDYTRARLRVTEEGLELEIALETVETGRLTGRMVDVEENPLPQLRLWLASTTGTRSALPLASDARGEFVVDEAPAGALAFDTRSSPRLSVSGLRLPAGQERDVVLVLDWGEHVLEGQVLDDRGRPVAGAQATLAWSHQRGSLSSRSRRQAVTDGSGAFRFVQLGPGRHALEVHASGFRVAREKLDVDRYAAEVEIRLEPSPE